MEKFCLPIISAIIERIKKGGKPWVGFVFICQVEDKEPCRQGDGTKNIHWLKKSQLQKIFQKTPGKIFTLQLGVLDYYFNNNRIKNDT